MTITPGSPIIMSCRRAGAGPPIEGAQAGHECRLCHVELELSPEGQRKLRKFGEAMILLCNECSITAVELLKGQVTGPILHPAALEGLARSGDQRGLMDRLNRAAGK